MSDEELNDFIGQVEEFNEDIAKRKDRADTLLQFYVRDMRLGEEGQTEQNVSDMIADVLHAVEPNNWLWTLQRALLHAYEEIHGWGSAEGLELTATIDPKTKEEGQE